jgi:hypothetical protein
VPPKKRTRRGSRGGRNRKKKTATATGTGAIAAASTNGGEVQEATETVEEAGEAEQGGDEPAAGPVIHVPGRELGAEDGDASAPVKKKTRRGSRGGKNRKKKTAGAAGVGLALASIEAVGDDEPEATEVDDALAEEAAVDEAAVEEAAVEEAAVEEPAVEEAALQEPPAEEPRPEEPSQNGDGDADWGYTPMSQWGIDE